MAKNIVGKSIWTSIYTDASVSELRNGYRAVGCASVLVNDFGKPVRSTIYSNLVSLPENNMRFYTTWSEAIAVILAVKQIGLLIETQHLPIYSDSLDVVRKLRPQSNYPKDLHQEKFLNPVLQRLLRYADRILAGRTLIWVPRNENRLADKLAYRAMKSVREKTFNEKSYIDCKKEWLEKRSLPLLPDIDYLIGIIAKQQFRKAGCLAARMELDKIPPIRLEKECLREWNIGYGRTLAAKKGLTLLK